MKAEQRKHLEQNELAARLSQWWKGSGQQRSSVWWAVLGVAVLAVVLYFAWRYYSDASFKTRSEQWREFAQAVDAYQLEQILDANKASAAARAAKAQLARGKMQEGLEKLGSDLRRKDGIDQIEIARGLYDELAKEAGNDPVLLRESLLGRAKSEEALVGVTRDSGQPSIGSLDRALELYDDLANKFGESVQGKEAAERAKDIRENKPKVLAFYEELNRRYANVSAPKLPDTPLPEQAKPGPTIPTGPNKPIIPAEPPKLEAPKPEPAKNGPPIKPVEPAKKDAEKPEPIPPPKAKDKEK
jgi:hypothetical protein